ncbi:MAG: response regulator [Pseudomonadota bacterium]
MNITSMLLSSKPLTILLIDDDDGDAKAIQRAFHKAKVANHLLRAVDGIEAFDMLRGTNGVDKISPPYILLVDLNMPRMNGIQFIQALREDKALSNSIAFILTTSKRQEDTMAAYSFNVAGYINKATAGQDFLKLVNLIDSYWCIVEMP